MIDVMNLIIIFLIMGFAADLICSWKLTKVEHRSQICSDETLDYLHYYMVVDVVVIVVLLLAYFV